MSESIEQLLAAKEVIVVCGPGGVGKTTVAAAAGLVAAVHVGGRVLVLTVDPARRLATALGLEALGNAEVQIPAEVLAEAGATPRGELWVAQLDTKQSWDDLIRLHAPDAQTRDAILGNSLYANVTAKFVQSHDYIAMERLYEIHASGRYDLIIVDTPPSRSAVDFLDAPERMAEFFGSRLLRWLTVPYRSRLFTSATRPFYNIADRVLGQQFLRDIADFFLLFQTMYPGFVSRAEEVQRTLQDRRTSFVVVSTLDASSMNECDYFIDALAARRLSLGAVVLNRVLPSWFTNKTAAAAARKLGRRAPKLATNLKVDGDPVLVEGVLREISESFLSYGVAAARQQELRHEMQHEPPMMASLPFLAGDIVNVEGLAEIGDHLRA